MTPNPLPVVVHSVAQDKPAKPYDFDNFPGELPTEKGQVPAFVMRDCYEAMRWISNKCVHQSTFQTFSNMLTKMSLLAHILKPDAQDSEFQYHLWQGKPIAFNGKKKKPYMLSVTFPTGERVTYRMRVNLLDAIISVEIVDTVPQLVRTLGYSLAALRTMQATATDKRMKALAKQAAEDNMPLAELTKPDQQVPERIQAQMAKLDELV